MLLFTRVMSAVERSLCRGLLGVRIASPFEPLRRPGSLWLRIKRVIADPAAWKGLAYGIIALPMGVISFTVAVTIWALAAAVTYPLFGWAIPMDGTDGRGLGGWAKAGAIGLTFLGGLIALLAAPWVVRGLAYLDRTLVRALLGRSETAVLAQRVEQLTESREASVDAAEAERRRIERDLHDGAQQRLVALAMDLGLAKERLDRGDDPAAAAALVGQAHDEAKRAITELRELVRGIHPAVLADRGLDAALSAVAARCPGAGRPRGRAGRAPSRRRSRRRPTSWWPRRSPTSPSTARPAARGFA